jgi:hypothetical protein
MLNIEYNVETYDEKLLDDLAAYFGLKWFESYHKGCLLVYSTQSHQDAVDKLRVKACKTPWQKLIVLITTLQEKMLSFELRQYLRQNE